MSLKDATLPAVTSVHAPEACTEQMMTDGYRADIDGLRGIAVLAVVAFHTSDSRLPGGFTGVDVFFVISGYLITGILLREHAAGRASFAMFYARRVRRIFPALGVVLLASWVMGWMFQ